MGHLVRVEQAEQQVAAHRLVALGDLHAPVGVANHRSARLPDVVHGDLAQKALVAALGRIAGVLVGAQLGHLQVGQVVGHRGDEPAPVARIPHERLLGGGPGLLVGLVAVHHGEGGGPLVAERPHRLVAVGVALAEGLEPLGQVFGRLAHGERAQSDAPLADLVVAGHRAGGPPDGRVGILAGLGQHPALGHRPVVALELVLVVGPAAHDVAKRLVPLGPGLVGVDIEALELGPGGRAAGAELHPPVADEVEHRHRLRRAHRVVVGLGQKPHAVADPQVLGERRDVAVEHLGVGAVGVLLQEVVLHRPKRVEAHLVAQNGLFDGVLVGVVLTLTSPGPGHRNLVEHRKLHANPLVCAAQFRGRW